MIFFIKYVSKVVPPSSLGVARISNYVNNNFKIIFTIIMSLLTGVYFFTVNLLCMFSVLGNIYTLNLYGKDLKIHHEMPEWVRTDGYCFILNILIYSHQNDV